MSVDNKMSVSLSELLDAFVESTFTLQEAAEEAGYGGHQKSESFWEDSSLEESVKKAVAVYKAAKAAYQAAGGK